jgi:succinate dehydrogenase hydrophobic anchor subunit
MGLTINPVSLTAEQVEALNRKLSDMRHDVNNYLSMMVAALELIKYSPSSAARMTETLNQQPQKISEALNKFSAEFEKSLGIIRQP